MCVTDRHDMTLAVKVALNPNTNKKLHIAIMTIFLFDKVENTVGERRKCW